VPEAAPEMPVAKVEAPVMVCEDSVELPLAVDNVPDAVAVLEPEWEAVVEEEVELEEPPEMVSPASSQVSLNHLVAASS